MGYLQASLAEELKLSSQHCVNQPCVEVCSLFGSDCRTVCDRSMDGVEVCTGDDGVVGESVFTRCDDVDVVGNWELGIMGGVIIAVAAGGDFEDGSSLTVTSL